MDTLEYIIREVRIKFNDHKARIVECEYYDFNDPFCYKHEKQKEYGTFFLHGYGTYKGLDITCNGGILIRSILIDDDKIIEGPSKVVDYILEKTQWNIKEIESKLELIESDNEVKTIYYGARKGITLKRQKLDEDTFKSYIAFLRAATFIPKKGKETFFLEEASKIYNGKINITKNSSQAEVFKYFEFE
jgi:hypothetical protein